VSDPRQLRRAFLRQLKRQGYGCMFRRAGWCEVLVWRAEERWLGEGPDRRAALAAVLARMFPSAAARAALLSQPEEPRPAPVVVAAEPESAAEPEIVPEPVPEPPPAPVPVLWVPASPALARPSKAELDGLHEELNELTETLESFFVDVLEWAPERQRLITLAWVARARDVQERALRDASVEQRVGGFCSRLGSLTKIGWPGNVAALGLHASPSDCQRDLGPEAPSVLPDWLAVADGAEAALERLDAAAEARGIDEQGWADGAFLDPAPPDPRSLLSEVRAHLETWTGPICDAQAILDGAEFGGEPSWSLVQALPGDPTRVELLRLARKLRWLRGCDLRGWGESMGRVRWIAYRGRQLSTPELELALDPRARPRQSWAKECGYDPEARARKQRKNELYKRLPGVPRGDRAALADWLREALGLGEEMSNDKLADALADRAQDVLALSADTLPVRAQRNRLRRLQEILGSGTHSPEPEQPEDEGPLPASEPPADGIPERLLAFTRGKRALIVGNRADPQLDAALADSFGFAALDRCDLAPNRIESHADRIRARSYDLVLATTGFMPHKADHALRKACNTAQVLFVRVNKGRPSACARHLARELGLQPELPALLT
jgi:hypothetical protein